MSALLEDVQPLSIGGHQAILDSVVHHLDEVAGAVRPTVQVALLGRAAELLAPIRPRRGLDAGRQCGKDWVEMADYVIIAANHQTVPLLESPHAAARPDVHVVDVLRL